MTYSGNNGNLNIPQGGFNNYDPMNYSYPPPPQPFNPPNPNYYNPNYPTPPPNYPPYNNYGQPGQGGSMNPFDILGKKI